MPLSSPVPLSSPEMAELKAMVEKASREMVESMQQAVAPPAAAEPGGNGKRRVT